MCRWIAYRGETIPLEHYVTAPAHSLVVQSLGRSNRPPAPTATASGWAGTANTRNPGLYREVRPAWSDENLRYLCRHIRSHLYFAHVRASTGTPITRPNCHPFACGRWMFMHNGLVGNWSRLRRQVEALIPDELYGSRIGTTDSEAVFLAILGAGGDKDPIGATSPHAGDADRHAGAEQGAAALHRGARRRPRPLRLPLRRQRQRQHALLSRIRRQRRGRVRAARHRARATGSRCRPATW